MRKTFASYNNIISSLGFDSETVVTKVRNENSGLTLIDDLTVLPHPIYASVIDDVLLEEAYAKIVPTQEHTRLEKMMLLSIDNVLKISELKITDTTGLIISTTKGNVDVLDNSSVFKKERSYLWSLGNSLATHFGFKTKPIIVSNACVSGVLAIAVAKRYIAMGRFDEVIVVSGDMVSPFILSGFDSFQALSKERCKPYDKNRTGINIGEVAATVLVTTKEDNLAPEAVEIMGDSSCNDANHISGPSRTGEGLFRSINNALSEAKLTASDIDYISAHGTATSFNDEMESIAFGRAGMSEVPINSYKGYFGHTLGASGLLETILGMHSMYQNTLFKSLGFSDLGMSQPLNIIKTTIQKPLSTFIKTASGFGGCNTAVIFRGVNKNK